MFATKTGNVRRNSLADFESINRNGKIAMKLDEGDRIVRVAICRPGSRRLAVDAQATPHPTVRCLPEAATTNRRGTEAVR